MVNNRFESLSAKFDVEYYEELVEILSTILKSILKNYPQINSICAHSFASFIEVSTQIEWPVFSNLTYKNETKFLLGNIAEKCSLAIVQKGPGSYRFASNQGANNVLLENCCGDYLNKCLELAASFDHRILYGYWCQNGRKVGKKDLWPSSKLIELLREYGLKNINWPTTHSRPVQFRRLLKILPDVVVRENGDKYAIEQVLGTEWIRDSANKLSIPLSIKKTNTEFVIYPVSQIQPHQRNTPYIYVLATKKGSKIGSADRTQNRFGDDDFGLVLNLNFMAGDEVAKKYEAKFARFLKSLDIDPLDGKRDHFSLDIEKMMSLFVSFFAKEPNVKDCYLCVHKAYPFYY